MLLGLWRAGEQLIWLALSTLALCSSIRQLISADLSCYYFFYYCMMASPLPPAVVSIVHAHAQGHAHVEVHGLAHVRASSWLLR